MEDKVILITGATDGIGKQTALVLAHMGACVLLHGRNPNRGLAALDEIRQVTDNPNLDLLIADLSSQVQVCQLAAQVQERYQRLDVLINNAGVFMKRRVLTEDCLETTFAVNHLAPFLLTHLLLDLLEHSAPARVITVSSNTHQWVADVDFNNLQGERHFNGDNAYALSKLGNALFTYELADRLKGSRVTANALHPGVIATKLLQAGFVAQGVDVDQGAETPVYLASSPDVEGVSGRYFIRKRPVTTSALSRDIDLRRAFWEVSEQLTRLNEVAAHPQT